MMQTPAPPLVVNSTERRLTRRGVLWLGLHCDVRCKFCYDGRISVSNKTWITLDDAINALNKFRHYYHNNYVDFMGGEPTLHPKIIDIVRHASEIGLRPTIITHGMHLADLKLVKSYADAGIHDFLVSIHGLGETIKAIHGRGNNNFAKQIQALDNMRTVGIPFRFNCILIRDNLDQLESIVELACEKGASVVNFLTFNPYFEWSSEEKIGFQIRHSEIMPYLVRAIDKCNELRIEANVRYIPLCQLPGYESHVYTGFQLPYDSHEWDYNSWYDCGYLGKPSQEWYLSASRRQRERHKYIYVPECNSCAIREICDGFHAQYVERWGSSEANPYLGISINDPCHFIKRQPKIEYIESTKPIFQSENKRYSETLVATQFSDDADNRAGVKPEFVILKDL